MAAAAKLLSITLDEFIQKYTKLSQDRKSLIFTDREDGACVFLSDDNRCKIYEARPWQCRTFPHEWDVPPDMQKLCPGHRLAERADAAAADALPLIHVLGHPALPMDITNAPGDAQVLNCHNFCLMLSLLGLPYIYYGCPSSKVPPGGAFVDCGKPIGKWSYRNKWHQIYNKRLSKHLAKCARLDGKPEIIASIYGAAQSDIETFGLPVIEAMVGYDHCWAPYRVFPSYAHQHTIYAQQPDFTAKNRFFDTVIPHFLDDTQYWPSSNPQDYLLFIGRDAPGKGLAIAQQAAANALRRTVRLCRHRSADVRHAHHHDGLGGVRRNRPSWPHGFPLPDAGGIRRRHWKNSASRPKFHPRLCLESLFHQKNCT